MSKINAKYSVEQEKNLFSEVPSFFDIEKSVEVSFTAHGSLHDNCLSKFIS